MSLTCSNRLTCSSATIFSRDMAQIFRTSRWEITPRRQSAIAVDEIPNPLQMAFGTTVRLTFYSLRSRHGCIAKLMIRASARRSLRRSSEGDNPPVGILLCTDKNHALAEYALAGMDTP